jgi:cytochrome P450
MESEHTSTGVVYPAQPATRKHDWEQTHGGTATPASAPRETAMASAPAARDTDAVPTVRGRPRRAIPGPPAPPLLGWRATAVRILRDPVVHLLRLQRRYGDIVSLGHERSAPVCVFAPVYNRQLLTDTTLFYSLDVSDSASPIRMPPNTSISRLLSGVAGMTGPHHKRHRHMLLPGFHRKRVDALRDTMVECIERHVAGWRVGQTLNLEHEMVELSLSLAISGLIGLDPDEEGSRVRQRLDLWSKHGLSPQVAMLPYDLPGLPFRRFRAAAEDLEAELRALIARKRAQGIDDGSALSILLEAQDKDGDSLTDDELLGHLTTLFTAGHETTASALTWTLFLLTQHPRILSDLMDELDGALHGEAPTLEQLRALPLLSHVIDEGLRMFPPGMWLVRTSTAPFEMGGYALPQGTHIIFSPGATHYRPDLYEQPHRFMPSRWETLDRSPYEYLPFGAGSRRCLGATFATLELQLALPIILQRFSLVVPPRTRVDRAGSILSRPKGGLPLVLYPPGYRYPPSTVRGNIHDLVQFA